MMKSDKPKVLIVAHDAGGAEIIAAYVRKYAQIKEFIVYVAGPAERVFRRNHIPFKRVPSTKVGLERLIYAHADVSLALLGSGWMTSIEFDALLVSKAIGIKTAVYLESWVNYRERFKYPTLGWKANLPDEIWVGDQYALVLAQKYFPASVRLRMVPNQYFADMKAEYQSFQKRISPIFDILFLSDTVPGMEQVFEDLLISLKKKYPFTPKRIMLGFHPADDRRRYDAVIARYRDVFQITKSKEKLLVRNLLRARVVIGTETVALVVSVLVGKKTISIRMSKRKWMLPFPNILHATSAAHAVRLI